MIGLAWRNLFRHKRRTATTLASIAFGAVGLILTGGFVQDIFDQLGEALIHSQTGHLQVYRSGYLEAGTRSPERYFIDAPRSVVERLQALPDVTTVLTRVAFAGLLNNGRNDWAILGEGIEPGKEARLGTFVTMISGRPLRDDDRSSIVVGQGVAAALGLKVGDRTTLVVNTTGGALNSADLEVVGIFQTFSKDYDARAVRISLVASEDLLQTSGITSIVVLLRDTKATGRVASLAQSVIKDQPLELHTWRQLNDFYDKTITLYERQFGVLQLIILGMIALSVANSVNLNVFERTAEFGTMKALGARGKTVASLVMVECALLGIGGGAVGMTLGVVLAWTISAIGIPMPPPPNANLGYTAYVQVVPGILVLAVCVAALATVLAGILPALKVARMPIVDALRTSI